MRQNEDICVFYREQPTYNPQMEYAESLAPKGAITSRVGQTIMEPFHDAQTTNNE